MQKKRNFEVYNGTEIFTTQGKTLPRVIQHCSTLLVQVGLLDGFGLCCASNLAQGTTAALSRQEG